MPPLPEFTGASPSVSFFRGFLQNLHWIVVALAGLFTLEAIIVLRRFKKLGAAREMTTKSEPGA
jgi:hypothetical protein